MTVLAVPRSVGRWPRQEEAQAGRSPAQAGLAGAQPERWEGSSTFQEPAGTAGALASALPLQQRGRDAGGSQPPPGCRWHWGVSASPWGSAVLGPYPSLLGKRRTLLRFT